MNRGPVLPVLAALSFFATIPSNSFGAVSFPEAVTIPFVANVPLFDDFGDGVWQNAYEVDNRIGTFDQNDVIEQAGHLTLSALATTASPQNEIGSGDLMLLATRTFSSDSDFYVSVDIEIDSTSDGTYGAGLLLRDAHAADEWVGLSFFNIE